MEGITLRMVNVKDEKELARAHVNPDNSVTYSQGDLMFPSLMENVLDGHPNLGMYGVAKLLKKDGWSNGYIMIARDK